jgi:hypothetical protein
LAFGFFPSCGPGNHRIPQPSAFLLSVLIEFRYGFKAVFFTDALFLLKGLESKFASLSMGGKSKRQRWDKASCWRLRFFSSFPFPKAIEGKAF